MISQESCDLECIHWQWQSDSNPYKEADPTKWTWKNYSDDENLIIEEAYFLNQETAILKDYEIDLKRMVQVTLVDKSKVRRIRRQGPSRLMMRMPRVNSIAKDQKTMNEAFGTVQHFLEYIMMRTPEAYTLYQKLKGFSLDCKRDEFEDLVHQVKTCIEKGAMVRAKIIKSRTSARVRDFISEARKILDMIENNSATLQNFLASIVKTYTMETFICYWLNELLRSEDWEEINVLTSFLVCLVYTFKLPEYVLQSPNSQTTINNRFGFVVKHKLHLYRGATLTEDELMSYNPNKVEYFSWNAVTSTSREKSIALKFMDLSFAERGNIKVVFFIEIDFASLEDYHGMIDISKDSKYPQEQEVILAPGTVFQLLEISLIENDIYQIHLKVRKDLKTPSEDVHLLGTLQEQAIFEDRGVVDGLPSQKAFKVLELLRGNQLIRKLEIRNSGLEEHIMKQIENFRVTTNVRKEDIELFGNTIVMSSFSVLAHYFTMKNFNDILVFNKIRFKSATVKNYQIASKLQINKLVLKDETVEMFRKNYHSKALWEKLKSEIQPQRISLEIQKMRKEENEFRRFLEHITQWKPLENLTFVFSESSPSSLENLESFYQAISLLALNKLSLKCFFSDKELFLLQNALESSRCLQSLSLYFYNESRISDEGLKYLKSALISLNSLEYLSLDLESSNLSDQGLNHFTSVIPSLTFLQHLHLDFRSLNQISDVGLESLKHALISPTLLQYLSCGFFDCNQYSIKGSNHLMIASIFLKSSQRFSVDIQSSQKIFPHIQDDLQPLKNFENRNHLKKDMVSLTPLQLLFVDLKLCKQISDEELNHLESGLISLTSLQHLSLNFCSCKKISDKGLTYFSYLLKTFTSLQRLNLNLSFCEQISDKGLSHLSIALKKSTYLQHLSLDFSGCQKISDEGLDYLQNAHSQLTSLQHLSLTFCSCPKISNKRIIYFSHSLKTFTSLQNLYLNFSDCKQISDRELNHLSSSVKALISLQYLSLDLFFPLSLPDEIIKKLEIELMFIPTLRITTGKGFFGSTVHFRMRNILDT